VAGASCSSSDDESDMSESLISSSETGGEGSLSTSSLVVMIGDDDIIFVSGFVPGSLVTYRDSGMVFYGDRDTCCGQTRILCLSKPMCLLFVFKQYPARLRILCLIETREFF
jgi:hypothetical protein